MKLEDAIKPYGEARRLGKNGRFVYAMRKLGGTRIVKDGTDPTTVRKPNKTDLSSTDWKPERPYGEKW